MIPLAIALSDIDFFQRAHAGAADRFHIDLVVAARAVQRHQRAHLDLVAFARRESRVLRATAEHHGAHLGAIVFQGEVPVAGSGAREVGNLAGDPRQEARRLLTALQTILWRYPQHAAAIHDLFSLWNTGALIKNNV